MISLKEKYYTQITTILIIKSSVIKLLLIVDIRLLLIISYEVKSLPNLGYVCTIFTCTFNTKKKNTLTSHEGKELKIIQSKKNNELMNENPSGQCQYKNRSKATDGLKDKVKKNTTRDLEWLKRRVKQEKGRLEQKAR